MDSKNNMDRGYEYPASPVPPPGTQVPSLTGTIQAPSSPIPSGPVGLSNPSPPSPSASQAPKHQDTFSFKTQEMPEPEIKPLTTAHTAGATFVDTKYPPPPSPPIHGGTASSGSASSPHPPSSPPQSYFEAKQPAQATPSYPTTSSAPAPSPPPPAAQPAYDASPSTHVYTAHTPQAHPPHLEKPAENASYYGAQASYPQGYNYHQNPGSMPMNGHPGGYGYGGGGVHPPMQAQQPQVVIVQGQPQHNSNNNDGLFGGILAGVGCCLCLDYLF
ncbi:MAG: hypothetical protein DHS80DRAFT_23118 [Piptocephalis tieghemiana]|nr:MAG: hypothetical protein DHS80DRAFT_23118 [Piptocephalis tieghemiana]